MLFEEVKFHAVISLGRWIRFQAFPCHPTNGSCTNAHATETHADMMAQAGAVSPKMIAHFPKLLGVFVDPLGHQGAGGDAPAAIVFISIGIHR